MRNLLLPFSYINSKYVVPRKNAFEFFLKEDMTALKTIVLLCLCLAIQMGRCLAAISDAAFMYTDIQESTKQSFVGSPSRSLKAARRSEVMDEDQQMADIVRRVARLTMKMKGEERQLMYTLMSSAEMPTSNKKNHRRRQKRGDMDCEVTCRKGDCSCTGCCRCYCNFWGRAKCKHL
ncbi:hypothetical protein LSAT2_026787 [Lamellibrachia satsuma]|nr:hypothetical protein LSAT2_026787 [Lamellibrachia satsuma]